MDSNFAQDVLKGLSAPNKHLSSKYFYDDQGSRIFQEIMQMPEYYPTDSEFEILSLQAKQIFEALDFSQPFNVIELGAGDGFKTFKLLEFLVEAQVNFNYVPIDISKQAMEELSEKLRQRLPNLSINPQVGDYFEILKKTTRSAIPNLMLFLGGNIGNYSEAESMRLLELFHQNMNNGDKLLIGFDLKKNPLTIQRAYFDPNNVTKRFNLNLLIRMNRELGADFQIDDFDFYSHYNPKSGEVNSYIVSLKKQTVVMEKLNKEFHFDQNELIWTELSKKYDTAQIEQLASKTRFEVQTHFLDCKHYFTDSLWKKLA